MQYRRLGKTNLQVSELSFGAARGASLDPQQFITTVHAVIDAGINLIDTAEGYDNGESERLLGLALEGYPEVLVETKYCPYDSYLPEANYVGSPQALRQSADESLRRLKRDYLDIFLGHGIRSLKTLERFMTDGCYQAMLDLKQEGKVRFIGISELSEGDGTHEILQQAVPSGVFDVVMLTINFLLQTATTSVLPICLQHDVGTVVMMPLNQASPQSGLVSYEAALECVRRHIANGNLPDDFPYNDPGLFDFLKPFTIPEAALRYVLSYPVSTCCVGMSKVARVEENLGALSQPYLDQKRKNRLIELFSPIQTQIR